MAFAPGMRLGSYRIVAPLGEGGMGEVYRARDSKLDRDVALKILPETFASDVDRLARFTREARVLASLNHANIATIYGVEDSGRVHALVLELVEGQTLAERIQMAAGEGLPFDEVVAIAHQIVDALEAAHEQGIIHRDLKPANIKLTTGQGTSAETTLVKVLDFGLAKALADESAQADPTVSPTLTARATQLGVILGTAAYMAPEQARGRNVDQRADIWAFGCVLYEMLTGRRAFGGNDIADTLAFVITQEPDWSALPATTPAAMVRLLRRSLAKDRRHRLSHIGDARLELADAILPHVDDRRASVEARQAAPGRFVWLSASLALVGIGALVIAALFSPWMPWRREAARPIVQVSAELGTSVSLATSLTAGQGLALSPDGSLLAFIGSREGVNQLYLRRLDQLHATMLSGTAGASQPFFSPDSQWIAFFADAKLKKIAVNGGTPVSLCEAENPRGGAWGTDDTIVFSAAPSKEAPRTGLRRVPAAGGPSAAATTLVNDETTHRWPQVLPSGNGFLFTAHNRANDYTDAVIVVQAPDGARKVVHRGGVFARYLASGHLTFMNQRTLFAIPFDTKTMESTGPPVPVLQDVSYNRATGGAMVAMADNGASVFMPSGGDETRRDRSNGSRAMER